MTQRWHILTGEYPPQRGGVADYTRLVARGLAEAGDEVVVWAPRCDGPTPADPGIVVQRLPGNFGPRALAQLDVALARRPGRLLVQYTPHAFGCKAMNVPLCAWLWARGGVLDVMFHEVAFPFVAGQPLKHRILAAVQRGMASLLVRAPTRVFVSVPGWKQMLRPLAARFPEPIWTPVPSNLPVACRPDEIASTRARLGAGGATRLVGHFGTYSPGISRLLEPALGEILHATTDAAIVLIGRGSAEFGDQLKRQCPAWSARIMATGDVDASAAALHISACDLHLQPYPDGISSRRTSAMAALALGRAIVANEGCWSEPIWRASAAVELAAPEQMGGAALRLLDRAECRQQLGARALGLYRHRFAVAHTVAALRFLGVPKPLLVAMDDNGQTNARRFRRPSIPLETVS